MVRHGADKLALITTDSYRIGAHEQLRIYGRILGVPVYVVRDATELRETLASLRDKFMVLIDTMGMSQRDKMVAEQSAMLTGAGKLSRLLLLNATSRGDTPTTIWQCLRRRRPGRVILPRWTRRCPSRRWSMWAIRHQLDVCFTWANGQRVPEDLHLPDRDALIDQAPARAGPRRRPSARRAGGRPDGFGPARLKSPTRGRSLMLHAS